MDEPAGGFVMDSEKLGVNTVLGEPISDTSSESIDEQRRQIIGLEEEKGIFNPPEVDVPPRSDSDDDISLKGAANAEESVLTRERETDESVLEAPIIPDQFPMSSLPARRNSSELERRDSIASNELTDDGDLPEGHRFDYPSGPPPAYSSGDHTPEENPLIGEDEDVTATIQGNRFHESLMSGGGSVMSAMAASGLVAAATTRSMINNSPSTPAAINNDETSEDESEYSARPDARGVESIAPLGSEEKQLLHFIEAYTAESVPIEPVLKPFLLEYIPAIGDIDAFIKIPRPDEVEDNLGLTVLDEPAARQSDPTILGMQLRNETKDVIVSDAPVKKLERADKNVKEIEQWINNIKELHRTKPPDSVHYSKPMPDIEHLMQEWPPEVEELLRTEMLPSASLDVSLEQYADICLSLLDIPVHRSRIQSLHVLFTLFSEFRNSQHFRNLAENNLMNNAFKENPTDRLELL